jgi:predicted metal-dependent hydrolase
MPEERTDVAALFERMKAEIRATGPAAGDVTPAQVRLSRRDQAERLWAVSAERPIVGKGGPLKRLLRRLMRWYVEPAFADQRAFNDAVLNLIDDLDERISRLEAR